MTATVHEQLPAGIGSDALLAWLRLKLAEAKHALGAREQSVETWNSGTEEDWKITAPRGTKPPNKTERLKLAKSEARIAGWYRRDMELIQRLIEVVGERDAAQPAIDYYQGKF